MNFIRKDSNETPGMDRRRLVDNVLGRLDLYVLQLLRGIR